MERGNKELYFFLRLVIGKDGVYGSVSKSACLLSSKDLEFNPKIHILKEPDMAAHTHSPSKGDAPDSWFQISKKRNTTSKNKVENFEEQLRLKNS